jgi:threonylcarbamoyladenosine tRNA methylthiotransferase MtaB
MDVIAGFPGETEDEFADTYERLLKLPWSRLHVFPYSERPGTKAIKLENPVPRDVRASRAQRLRDLSTARFSDLARKQIGQTKDALVLKTSGSGGDTLTRDYWPVKLSGSAEAEIATSFADSGAFLHELAKRKGQEIRVRITGFDHSMQSRMDGVLRGEWVNP